MAYDKNTDYMAIMNAAKARGDMAAYLDAENKREEKLWDMNVAGTNTQGYTSTRTQPVANAIPTNFKGSTKSNTNVSAAAQKIIDQMNANSLKWYSDPANRSSYEQANQTLAQQLSSLKETDANGSLVSYSANHNTASGEWTVTPNYTQATATDNVAGATGKAPELAGLELAGLELGDKYGIMYDQPTIQKLLDDATRAQYDLKQQQATQSENKFYNTMLDTQGTALDTLRKSQASAVATGASRGMAAANELSAILNLQQTAVDESTMLAQNRDNLNTEEASAYKQNATDALNASNGLKTAIAGIAGTKYGYDTQGQAAALSYLAALADVAAQKNAANKTLEGVKYNADANVAAAGKTYGSSGKTYTSGNGSGNTGTTATNPELALKVTASGTEGYTPEGSGLNIKDNGDGTYTITSGSYAPVKDATLDDITRIQNNGWDIKAIDDNYAVTTVNKTTDPANNKNMSEREVLNYYNRYGKAPTGWQVNGDVATYKGATLDTSQNVSTTGKDGQKVSVGYGNFVTTWTYNAKTGMWSGTNGDNMSAASFKLYLNQQNNDYVKSLN